MSTFSNSETASASPSENHTSPPRESEATEPQTSWPDDASSEDGTPTLRMDQCPECGNHRFVSKLLVYEVTGYDEGANKISAASMSGHSLNTLAASARRYSGRFPQIAATTTTKSQSSKRNDGQPSVINSASWGGGSGGVSQGERRGWHSYSLHS